MHPSQPLAARQAATLKHRRVKPSASLPGCLSDGGREVGPGQRCEARESVREGGRSDFETAMKQRCSLLARWAGGVGLALGRKIRQRDGGLARESPWICGLSSHLSGQGWEVETGIFDFWRDVLMEVAAGETGRERKMDGG